MNRLLSSKSIKLKVERDNVINSATRDPSQIFAALKQSGGDGWTAEDATKVLYKLATAPVAAGQKIAIIQDQNFCILISILGKLRRSYFTAIQMLNLRGQFYCRETSWGHQSC